MPIKPHDELTIQDNFIKKTIERLLDISVKDISYPEEEKSIDVPFPAKVSPSSSLLSREGARLH